MKQYKIRYKPDAKNDLHDIRDYIAEHAYSFAIASKTMKNIKTAISVLTLSPYDRLIDKNRDYRKLVVLQTYIVIYTVNESQKTVEIVRVIDGRRDWYAILGVPYCMTTPH